MKTKTIHQTVTFKATPHEIYETLMYAKKHSQLTGSNARITKKVGDKFSIYEGEIEGVNLELVPDRKIVQSWRYSDWPEGHYSKATFLLEESKDATKLIFTQTEVPEGLYQDVAQGWRDYYWQPMKEMLEKPLK